MNKRKLIIKILVIFLLLCTLRINLGSTYITATKSDYNATKTVKPGSTTDALLEDSDTYSSELNEVQNNISNSPRISTEALKGHEFHPEDDNLFKNGIKGAIIPLLIISALYMIWIAGIQKVASDLEVSPFYRTVSLLSLVITSFVGIVSLYKGNINNFALFFVIARIALTFSIIGIFYKIGVNFFVLILALASPFIPFIGNAIYFIIFAYGMWLLGDHYNKSTSFKIGLILLNIIVLPAMAFDWKFIK